MHTRTARAGVAVAVLAAIGWFLLGRGGEAAAVTCIRKAGATVEESDRFTQILPYAVAVVGPDRVKSYSELDGAHVYSVHYGSDRALLFVGDDEEDALAFEATLADFVASGGATLPSRRAGKLLLVWSRPAVAPSVEDCIR